jgi:16S rRNA (cytosine967-C5)-methyltransferase
VIDNFSGCPLKRIQRKLLNIIRIACYEIIYTPLTQQYAIVNEAVDNTGLIAGKKQTGFVNALLRQIIRNITNRQIPLSQAGIKRTLIQSPETGCEFDSDFLPGSKEKPDEYFSIVFSLPQWLVTEWLNEFGYEKTRQICFASNRRPSVYIRANSLKTSSQELIDTLEKEGIELETIPNESVMRIKSPRAVSQLPGYNEGFFVVQDVTASVPVQLLKPQPDWKILDFCAAPGIKTTQLAQVTGDSAKIVATDIDSQRLEKVKENIERLGIKSVEIFPYEKLGDLEFDCILLDVPCSNTGVLAKRIEARYRIRLETITELAKTQRELLEKAAVMLKPHGKICYSTCSVQKNENSDVVKNFLRRHNDFKLETEQLILPSVEKFDRDGGYTAIISRNSKS